MDRTHHNCRRQAVLYWQLVMLQQELAAHTNIIILSSYLYLW